MTFLERATPYAKLGIPVFPLLPKEKRPPSSMTDWPSLATTNLAQIAAWNKENSDYNCGLVAKPDGGWVGLRNHSTYHNDTVTDRLAP